MYTRDESTYILRLWSDGGTYRVQLEDLRSHQKQLFLDVCEFEVFIKERVAWQVKKEKVEI